MSPVDIPSTPSAKSHASDFHPTRTFGLWLIIAALVLSALLNVDPGSAWGRYPDSFVFRYLPLILAVGGFFLICVVVIPGNLLKPAPIRFLLLLSFAMLLGSALQLADGARIQDSFLGRSLNILAILPGAMVAALPDLNARLLRVVLPIMIATAFLGLFFMLLRSFDLFFTQYQHVLREESIFYVAALTWVCRRYPSTLLRLAIIFIMLAIAFKTGKSTITLLSIVFAGLTFGGDLVGWILRKRKKRQISKGVLRLLIILAVVLVGGLALFLAIEVIAERSSRNEYDLRRKMWLLRWDQFLSSPIWGNVFTGTPLYYEPQLPGRPLPTHNDPLDLLAGGGVIAFGLYSLALIPLWFGRIGSIFFQKLPKELPKDGLFWLLTITYGVSALGNPVFNSPRIAVVVFFAIGHVAMSLWLAKSAARKT